MRKSRFSEEQIIMILREAETRAGTIADLCREHGISGVTFYKWRNKYGGMDVSEARRLRLLEQENTRLKKIVVEKELSIQILQEINSKNWLDPPDPFPGAALRSASEVASSSTSGSSPAAPPASRSASGS